jgi:hypothetical protein
MPPQPGQVLRQALHLPGLAQSPAPLLVLAHMALLNWLMRWQWAEKGSKRLSAD